jgi:hypothetical protein
MHGHCTKHWPVARSFRKDNAIAFGERPVNGHERRKRESIALTIIMGLALIGLALAYGIADFKLREHPKAVNIVTCVVFGGILFWWAFSEDKSWGIGFETITMAVTVILAVIAILTLTSIP